MQYPKSGSVLLKMKKNTRVSNIWTTVTPAATSQSTIRAPPRLTKHTGVRQVEQWASTGPNSTETTQSKAPHPKDPEKESLSLKDLEEELDKEHNKDVSLVDKEEKTNGKTKPLWAAIVRDYQFQSKAFTETVSMQGLAPIFDPHSSLKRKLVWCTIVLIAIIFTGFNIITQICMYMDKPLTVRVDFRKAKDLSFPTVTVCNNNFASLAFTSSFNAIPALKLVKPLLFQESNGTTPDFASLQAQIVHYNRVGWDVFYEDLAQDMAGIFLRCQWEQSHCSLANFTPVFTDMGLCYSFNHDGALKVREAGRAYGLKLTLDTKQDDYLRSMDQYYGAGFRVDVHAPGVPPIMSEKGVAVSPGQHNFLAIDVRHLKNAEPSISGCGSADLKYYPPGMTYSTEACRLECRADYIHALCGCRTVYMPNTDVRICDPPEFFSCFTDALYQYFQNSNQCEDQCPEPCSENLYRVTPSSNPLSQQFLTEFSTLQGQDAVYWSHNLLHLELYLTSMTYELVEKQMGYTLLQLFCDVGGAFGLLLGASLLTLLEIADFFLCRISKKGGTTKGGRKDCGSIGGGGVGEVKSGLF